MISRYIENRLRKAPPANCGVVPGAPPVISFGNFETARIATVGLNPSHREFSHGYLKSGFGDLESAPTSVMRAILDDQYSYFQRPQYRWFNRLARVVDACGLSYEDGTAASLDIVQWATQPVWGNLTMHQKKKLLESDMTFLARQIQNERIETVLVNGRGVMNAFEQYMGLAFRPVEVIEGFPGTPNIPDTTLNVGALFDKVEVIAWNVNLQGTPGVLDTNVDVLASRVARIAAA